MGEIKNDYTAIQPAHANFRSLEICDAFTWEDGIYETDDRGLYLVAFNSLRNSAASEKQIESLLKLDYTAYMDAQLQPGFITYWHDDEVPGGHASSFCLWETRQAGYAASQREAHQAAVRYTRTQEPPVYERYAVGKFTVVRRPLGRLTMIAETA